MDDAIQLIAKNEWTSGSPVGAFLQERKKRFQQNVRENIVSYLARNYGGTYFATGGASPCEGKKMVVKYANATTWQSYRWGETPVYSDTVNINGEDYNIMYCDCSSFVSLIYSGISYDESPYMYGFQGGVVNSAEMKQKGVPRLGYENDWLFDFNSLVKTRNMSLILTESGLSPLMLSVHNKGQSVEYDVSNIDLLETGDIVFSGQASADGDFYNSTGHVLIYVKTLEELQSIASGYNMTLKSVDNNDPTWGYVVEVTYSSSSENDYTNCLRIGTLKRHMDLMLQDRHYVYAYKMAPRNTISNSSAHRFTGIWRDYNHFYFAPVASVNPFKAPIQMNAARGRIKTYNFQCLGEHITEDIADADTIGPGVWRCTSRSILPIMKNIPINTSFFILRCDGVEVEGTFYGTQEFQIISRNYPRKWVRSCHNGIWTKWEPIPQIQNGIEPINVLANSNATIDVVFTRPFDTVPIPFAVLQNRDTGTNNMSLAVRDLTVNGFRIVVYNRNEVPITCGVAWTAISNDDKSIEEEDETSTITVQRKSNKETHNRI